MLTHADQENILREFPNIKLSYENIIYKKVYNSDYMVAIPEGKKCFAWFTNINEKMVCCIMDLSTNKQINDIKIVNTCFSNDLGFGTILYGTIIHYSNAQFFFIEDIFCYKGVMLERNSWGEKLQKINAMLKSDLKQVAYNNSFLVFGLPLMCKTLEELENRLKTISYNIESIQFILFNKVNIYLVLPYKSYDSSPVNLILYINENKPINCNQTINLKQSINHKQSINLKQSINHKQPVRNNEMVFLVKPDIQDDIYHLYYLNSELKEEKYSVAHIPDYNTSVMMNKLFRNIKENINLDALEESDDEEEFENENIDKFVHLDKSYKMTCQFNNKFKKWVPIKIARGEEMIVKSSELNNANKFYEQKKRR